MILSSAKTRYPLGLARGVAEELYRLLAPVCERIAIAGSIRRGQLEVGDIELLCISIFGTPGPPKVLTDLFGEPRATAPTGRLQRSLLDILVLDLELVGVFRRRLSRRGHEAFGPLNKLLVHVPTGIPVDLFSTTRENWGMALLVRTGPAEWNIRVMARLRRLGMMGHAYAGITLADGKELTCPSEESVFEKLGWEYVAPENRQ